jgi:hypothetical protein
MMQYNFADKSAPITDLEMEDNIDLYPTYQQQQQHKYGGPYLLTK